MGLAFGLYVVFSVCLGCALDSLVERIRARRKQKQILDRVRYL